MATTNGTLNKLTVTAPDGDVYSLLPVDTEARQEIEEAENLQFDEDYFTMEETSDELHIGLAGVPFGVSSPLRFDQDDEHGVVIGLNYTTSGGLVTELDGKDLVARRTYEDKEGNDLTLGIDGTINTVTDSSGEPVQDSSGNPLADAESDARVVSIGELPIWADRAEKDASGNDIEATYTAQTVIDNDYSTEDTYRYGETCMHEGTLYVCTEPAGIGTPEPWTPAHWASTNIAEQIRNLQEAMKMPKYLKTQEIVTYTLTGAASTATISPASAVVLQLTRMDDGVGGTNLISAAVPVTISKAQVTLGGAGAILSRDAKAAVLDISIVIPSAYAASGDTPVGSFKLSIGEWSRWEDKNIVLPITASDTDWSENYRTTKPVTLVATTNTAFYIEDFNIQDDFKTQTLPVYTELAIKANKLTSADGTALID